MMTTEPLSDADLEKLTDILKRFGSKRAMNAEQIDGFLAALVCGPSHVSEKEYLAFIWGDETVNEDGFRAQPILLEFIGLVARHKSAIAHTLNSGEVFTPLLLTQVDGAYLANDWAKGFLRGMTLRREEWTQLLNDDEHGGALVPILALAHENDPDPEMRPYKEPVTPERRDKLIVGAAAGVMNIFGYFEAERLGLSSVEPLVKPTYRRIAPKVGRNEPCPCGSGKKFKHCCGKMTLH
jgi:uncharacterized protein